MTGFGREDNVLVWCLGLSRAQSLPRWEHKERVPPASLLLTAHACRHHGAHSPAEAPPSLSELQTL